MWRISLIYLSVLYGFFWQTMPAVSLVHHAVLAATLFTASYLLLTKFNVKLFLCCLLLLPSITFYWIDSCGYDLVRDMGRISVLFVSGTCLLAFASSYSKSSRFQKIVLLSTPIILDLIFVFIANNYGGVAG